LQPTQSTAVSAVQPTAEPVVAQAAWHRWQTRSPAEEKVTKDSAVGQRLRQLPPNRTAAAGQRVHSLREGPVHSAHSALHALHVPAPLAWKGYQPVGHASRHSPSLRKVVVTLL
jgi:hypothetical protein